MTELFQIIRQFHAPIPGWCTEAKAVTLASIVIALRPEVSVEIGIYGGKSFFPIALAHKAINFGVAIGIDPWDTDVAIREQTCDVDREWWGNVNMAKLHGDFIRLLGDHKLDKYSKIIRKESRLVEPPNLIGLLHVDGSHSDTALMDMMRFAPRVAKGGFLVTDDTTWTGGGVARGEDHIRKLGFVRHYILETGAVFQRL